MRARAAVEASTRGIVRLRSEPPLALRCIGNEVWVVASAGGPVGGDDVHLDVVVDDATLAIRSAAASIVLPSRCGEVAHVGVDAAVGPGGSLRWAPEPVVVSERARLVQHARVCLSAGARLWWRDEVVLGRYGERGGEASARLRVERDGVALVHHELDQHRASIGDARVLTTVVVVDGVPPPSAHTVASDRVRAARFPLEAGGWIVLALGDTVEAVRTATDALAPAAHRRDAKAG